MVMCPSPSCVGCCRSVRRSQASRCPACRPAGPAWWAPSPPRSLSTPCARTEARRPSTPRNDRDDRPSTESCAMSQQQITAAGTVASGGALRRRLLYAGPAAGFVGLAAALGWGLTRNPRELPSTLIGRQVPTFSLPPVQGRALGLASTNLRGEVSLVNFFASWCVACRAEHPLLLAMAQSGAATIHRINYKDAPVDAARRLDTLGDPYTRS